MTHPRRLNPWVPRRGRMQWRETELVVKSASLSVAMMRLVLLVVTLALTVQNGRGRASWPSREVLEAHVAGTTEYTFDNHIDHFSFGAHASGASTYKQRYFVNKRFWRAEEQGRPGPIFFYAGNESPVELYINNTGLIWENARSFGALVMFAEHRYYGRSQPFGADSIDVDASYLLAEQALADYATLLWTWKRQNGAEDAPVVAFGGSYGGMLAAWLRLKYPHIVAGAVAASAPLGAFFGAQRHFQPHLFWKAVTYDASEAAGAAAGCVDRVRSGFAAVLALGDSAAGRSRLSAAFQLCEPLQSAADAVALAYWLQGAFDAYAMGNYPFPTSYMGGTDAHPLPAWPMREACSRVMAAEVPGRVLDAGDLLAALRAAVSMLYNATQDQSCFSLQTQGPAAGNVGPWDWQWCTEMLPQELPYFPSNGVDDMFWDQGSFSWTGLRKHCRKAWAVSPREHHTLVQFGGLDIEAGSNIVLSNGEYDPWRVWGVLESVSDSIIALDIRHAAHHLDIMFSHPDDPPSVRAARQREMQEVAKWIGAFRQRRARRSSFAAV